MAENRGESAPREAPTEAPRETPEATYTVEQLRRSAGALSEAMGRRISAGTVAGAIALAEREGGKPIKAMTHKQAIAAIRTYLKTEVG